MPGKLKTYFEYSEAAAFTSLNTRLIKGKKFALVKWNFFICKAGAVAMALLPSHRMAGKIKKYNSFFTPKNNTCGCSLLMKL